MRAQKNFPCRAHWTGFKGSSAVDKIPQSFVVVQHFSRQTAKYCCPKNMTISPHFANKKRMRIVHPLSLRFFAYLSHSGI
ncbi:MAG: hypothetical protein ACOX8N_08850, partial [Christensenellales bacterium]